jgi:hypothetical protein
LGVFRKLCWNPGVFRRLRWIFLRVIVAKTITFPLTRLVLFSSYAGIHKAGKPQASLELTADRLIFLDSAPENSANGGDTGDLPL